MNNKTILKHQIIYQITLLTLIIISAIISFNNPIVNAKFHYIFKEGGLSAAIAWATFFWILVTYPSYLIFNQIEKKSKSIISIIYCCIIVAVIVYIPIQIMYLLSQIA